MKKLIVCLVAVATFVSCSDNLPKQIGALRQKGLSEVHNDLAIGCETLDRDYADYHKYKEYLEPLGMRYIRLQAGWAKTEKVKGVYDFAWLDAIINDAVSRGLEPWLELSYGNPIYPGGGTIFLKGGWPRSKEAVAACKALIRYIEKQEETMALNSKLIRKPIDNATLKLLQKIGETVVKSKEFDNQWTQDALIMAMNQEYRLPYLQALGKSRKQKGLVTI